MVPVSPIWRTGSLIKKTAGTFLKPRYGRPKQSDSRANVLKHHSYQDSKDPYSPHKRFLSLLNWDFLYKDFLLPQWPLFYCSLYTTPLEHLSYILMTCWLNSLSLFETTNSLTTVFSSLDCWLPVQPSTLIYIVCLMKHVISLIHFLFILNRMVLYKNVTL